MDKELHWDTSVQYKKGEMPDGSRERPFRSLAEALEAADDRGPKIDQPEQENKK